MNQLEVLIVTYNSAYFISGCIRSIRDHFPDLPLYVVDNASTDETPELLKGLLPSSHLTFNTVNQYLTPVWNAFLKQSQSKYVLFLNPDSLILDPMFIEKSVAILESEDDVVLAGYEKKTILGALEKWEAPIFPEHRLVFEEKVKKSEWFQEIKSQFRSYSEIPFSYPSGTCMLFDREKVLELGGFSEDLPFYFNDTELGLRIAESGYRMVTTWHPHDGQYCHIEFGSTVNNQTYSRKDKGSTVLLDEPVSIIMPVLTEDNLWELRESVQSLLNQSYPRFELIVVTDLSQGDLENRMSSFTDVRMRTVYLNKKSNRAQALNEGIKSAYFEYLTWAFPNVIYLNRYIEAHLTGFQGSKLAVSLSPHVDVDDENAFLRRVNYGAITLRTLFEGCPTMVSFMYQKACHEGVGYLDDSLDCCEDWDFWLRIAEQFPVVYVEETLCHFRLHAKRLLESKADPVRQTSKEIFQTHFKSMMSPLDWEVIYPGYQMLKEKPDTPFYARFDFGTLILRSDFTRSEEAIPFLEEAHAMNPDHLFSNHNLAYAYIQCGSVEKAKPLVSFLKSKATDVTMPFVELFEKALYDNSFLEKVPIVKLAPNSVPLLKYDLDKQLRFSFARTLFEP